MVPNSHSGNIMVPVAELCGGAPQLDTCAPDRIPMTKAWAELYRSAICLTYL